MNGQSILGDTLFYEPNGIHDPGTEENYYLMTGGLAIETGDPAETFGISDPRGAWGYFKNHAGSMMGYNGQRRRDHAGKPVDKAFNNRLAELQGRITCSESGYRNKQKYVELASSLVEFFPEQVLAKAMMLFEKIQSRLTGDVHNDIGCVLACVEFWLLDQGTMIKNNVLEEINQRLDLQLSRCHVDKHKWSIKQACIELYGRKVTFSRFHRKGPGVIKKHLNEILMTIDLDSDTKQELKQTAYLIVKQIIGTSFMPKNFENHAYAILKIAGEELDTWNSKNWNNYFRLDDKLKTSVYMAAYKYRKKINDWTFIKPVEELDVLTSEEVQVINVRESYAEVMNREVMFVEMTKIQEGEVIESISSIDDFNIPMVAVGDYYPRLRDKRFSDAQVLTLNLLVYQLAMIISKRAGEDDNRVANASKKDRSSKRKRCNWIYDPHCQELEQKINSVNNQSKIPSGPTVASFGKLLKRSLSRYQRLLVIAGG
ncbi:MAG: hypothetical protein ACXAEU_08300 [Candidatus Hodarchaeales archaeon]|jgi:hypothetical protein